MPDDSGEGPISRRRFRLPLTDDEALEYLPMSWQEPFKSGMHPFEAVDAANDLRQFLIQVIKTLDKCVMEDLR